MRASSGPRLLLRAAIERQRRVLTSSSSSSASASASASSWAPAATPTAPLASRCAASALPGHDRSSGRSSDVSPWPWLWSRGGGAATTAAPRPCSRAFSSSSSASSAEMHGTTVLAVRHRGSIVIMADGQISMGSKVVKPNARKLRRLLPQAAGAPAASSPSSSSSPPSSSQFAPDPSDLASLPGGGLVIGGFAGSTADGVTLFERLEGRLREHPGQLRRAAVDLAKAWRQDRVLRRLRAAMLVADATGACLEVSGNGDVLEPADGVHAIGSGARYALAAARALVRLDADEQQRRARAGSGAGGTRGGGGGGGYGEGGGAPEAAAGAGAAAEGGGSGGPEGGDRKGLFTALDIARRAMRVASDRCVYTNTCWTWEGIDERTGASFSGGSGSGSGKQQEQQQHQEQPQQQQREG